MTDSRSIRFEFWSGVEFSGFMRGIVTHMKEDGFADVRHHFQISERGYRAPKNALERLWLRFRMYAVSPAALALRMIFDRRKAVVVVSTNPFFSPALACLLRSRRHKIVHLVYDVYPDALLQTGKIREGSPAFRAAAGIAAYAFHHADANVFLSTGASVGAGGRVPGMRRPSIIPIGADDIALRDPLPCKNSSGPVSVLYCGNMGRMHDVDTLAGALKNFGAEKGVPGVRVEIHASGYGYARLCQAVGGTKGTDAIALAGYLPEEEWRTTMLRTDVALITIRRGAENVVMPSKLYTAMQAGQAVIAVTSANSDLARTVRECDCGWVVEPGDTSALTELLRSLPLRREEIRVKQMHSLEASTKAFSSRVSASKWEALAEALAAEPRPSANEAPKH